MAKFKPGQSGNPGGRPPSHLNKLLSRYLRAKDGDKTREQKLVEKIYELAQAGDMRAAALIWDRMEGKVCEELELPSQHLGDFNLDLGKQVAMDPEASRLAAELMARLSETRIGSNSITPSTVQVYIPHNGRDPLPEKPRIPLK